MTFAAIVGGGKGVTYYIYSDSKTKRPNGWWGLGVTHTPEHWATFSKVIREISAIEKDLAARDAKVQPTVDVVSGPKKNIRGTASVNILLKETGLLMALNSSTNQVVAELKMPGCGKVKTLTLEPFGVAVERVK